MFDSQVLAFTVLAALMTMSPGADTLLVVRNALRGGRRDGLATALGICSGLYVHALLSALGVSMVLMHSATAFTALKFAGAAYLVWLGLQSLRSAGRDLPQAANASAPLERVPARRSFREGFLTNLLNPKVIVFYLALLPQFIDADAPHKTLAFVFLGLWFVVQGGLFSLALVLLAALARHLPSRPGVGRALNLGGAGLFTFLAMRLALAERH